MNSVFGEQILADKLSKLNSTQQCIETLSHWCIFHRTKAEIVVTTWEKQFHSSDMAQKVPLLYLANDILQNSKRKGNEFVTEFWKVLPKALKEVVNQGDDRGKKVVSRLVGIWEERRVFGSHAKSLKDAMLGDELPPPLELRKKRSRSVRIVKKDSRSIKTKLSIGGTVEKIVTAFHAVLSDNSNEDEEMGRCKSAVHHVKKMEKDVDVALTKAKDPSRKTLSKELEEEENLLKECIDNLKAVETNRVALVSQLKGALNEQESELENLRTQIQVAQAQVEEAKNMRKQLDEDRVFNSNEANSTKADESKKSAAAIAAKLADKLVASTSSQYIMTSVLSTFAAEEAKNAGLTTSAATSAAPSFSSGNNGPVSDPNAFVHPSYQLSNSQPHYHNHSIPNTQPVQYMQQQAGYDYGNLNNSMAQGPAQPYMVSTMVPLMQQMVPMGQQQQQQQQQPMMLPQQQQTAGSFRPVQTNGMVYYNHPYRSQ